MTLFRSLATWARSVPRDVVALWLAARDRRVPWSAKIVAGAVAAYALSPIDLIPDVIPVLGYLDDLIIVPLGILWAVRLVPAPLMREFRVAAARYARPTSYAGLAVVVMIWLAAAVLVGWYVWPGRTTSGLRPVPSRRTTWCPSQDGGGGGGTARPGPAACDAGASPRPSA